MLQKNRKNTILVFDALGNIIHLWESPGIHEGDVGSPSGIALSPDGNLYITDEENHRIQIVNSQGQLIGVWGSNSIEKGYFYSPRALTLDTNGDLLVCDTENHRVQKFNTSGELLKLWGNQGSQKGQFKFPQGIAVDSMGNIYISDTENDRIQKFSSSAEFLFQIGSYGRADGCEYDYTSSDWIYKSNCNLGNFNYPKKITVDPQGYLYTTDSENHRIQVFDMEGSFYTYWGEKTKEDDYGWPIYGDGDFYSPTGIAYDPKGYIYVTDSLDRIQKFLPGGGFITKWGNYGNKEEEFRSPEGIAIDVTGNVYVADKANNRIQKFTSEGEFISQFGTLGSGPGQFNTPTDIAVSPEGKIYVADSKNHRIQVFSQKDYTSDIKKAIIVAGGGDYQGNTLWGATQMCANYAYRALIYQGFDKQTIHYLSSDTDLDIDSNGEADDVDSNATNANLQNALIHWAKDADELVLYITDHGGDGSFRMTDTELLQASDLNTWLDQLQAIKNASVVVIYDACQSGSFLPILATSETPNRVVISSAQKDEPAYFTSAGALSFSYFFWGNIFNGMTVGNAFFSARNSTRYAYSNQSPLLDDNGNGIGNEDDDGIAARDIHIGNGVVSADDLPVIGSPVPTRHLYGESSVTLSVSDVTDAGGISRVWATLTPPDREIADPSIPILDIEIIDFALTDDNRYEGEVKGLSATGTYTLALFAKDKNNTISLPIPTQIIQHGSTDNKVPYSDEDLTLFIPSLRYESSCFSLTLRLSSAISTDNSLVWYHGSSLLLQDTCPPNGPWMNDTMQITIPEFECMDDVYRFRLNNYLNPTDPFRDYWTLDESSIELTN